MREEKVWWVRSDGGVFYGGKVYVWGCIFFGVGYCGLCLVDCGVSMGWYVFSGWYMDII